MILELYDRTIYINVLTRAAAGMDGEHIDRDELLYVPTALQYGFLTALQYMRFHYRLSPLPF